MCWDYNKYLLRIGFLPGNLIFKKEGTGIRHPKNI
jgi:hypothetical protein